MLLLNIEILALGRMAITDSVLIFFTTLSLYSFGSAFTNRGRGRHWIWAFYVGMALATLTKGPVGFAVPLITALLVSHRHSAMAGLLAKRRSYRRHVAVPSPGGLPGISRCSFSMEMPIPLRRRSTQLGDSSLRWKAMEWAGGSIFPSCCWAFIRGAHFYPPRSIEPISAGENPLAVLHDGMARHEQSDRQDPVMNWIGLQASG